MVPIRPKRQDRGMRQSRQPGRTRARTLAATCAALVVLVAHGATAALEPPAISSPTEGAVVPASPVTIAGTAPGEVTTVRVYEGGTVLAETGPSGGYWSVAVPFADGAHTIAVRGRTADGDWTSPSASRTFTVDTVAPLAPTIVAPTDGQTLAFADVVVEGTAEPGAQIVVAADTGATLTAVADGAGWWRADGTFTDAAHTIEAVAVDGAGHHSPPSNVVRFVVDTRAPSAPIIDTPIAGALLRTTTVTVHGRAEPGATVTIFESATIATVVASSTGAWSFTRIFEEGAHTLTARATDAAGHVSASSPPRTFTIDASAPPAPTITSPAEGSVLRPPVTVGGLAEPGTTVELLEGGAVAATTTATAAGTWSVQPTLFSGPYSFSARARDAAGNVGATSAPRSFVIDVTPPTVAITTQPRRIYMPSEVPVIEGTASDAIGVRTIELHYYDPFARVTIRFASCWGCGSGDATWRSTYPPPTGYWTVKAYAIDLAGNRSVADQISFVRI